MKISGQPEAISYSPAGSALSREISEKAHGAQEESEKRDVLTRGFSEVYSSSDTTEAEKALAQLGWSIGKNGSISSQSAREAELSIFNIIMAGIPTADTIGGLLARTALDATQSYGGINTFKMPDPEAEQIRLSGFQVIAAHPDTLEEEHAIALLGSTIDSKSIAASPKSTALAQKALLTTIQHIGFINSPLAPVIVKTTLDVTDNVEGLSTKSRDLLLQRGLYVILKEEGTSEADKALASFGMDIPERMGETVLAAAKRDMLETIAAHGQGSGTEAILKAARSLLKDDGSPGMAREILGNAFSSINHYCKGDAATETLSSLALSIAKQKTLTGTAARDTMLKIMDCLPGQPCAFEVTAASLAKKTGELSSSSLQAGDRAIIMLGGLEAISQLQDADDRQRRYAQLGVAMGRGIQDEIALKVSTAILDTITNPPGQRETDIVTGIAQRAMESGATAEEKSQIAGAAFGFIVKDPDATECEKTLAQLGVAMGGHKDMSGEGSGIVRSHIFSVLKDRGQAGAIDGKSICTIAKDGVSLVPGPSDGRKALRGAFETIAAYPRATSMEKKLAEFGVSTGGHDQMGDRAGLKVRMTVLDALMGSQYSSGSPGTVMANLAKQAIINQGFASGDERRALKGAFESIAKDPQASELEREIAGLAVSMGGNPEMNNEPGAKIRAALLDTLLQSSTLTGSSASILAEAAKKAAGATFPMCDGRKALKGALDWIAESPRSSAHDRALASLAINMGGHTEMTDDSAFRVRLALMDSFSQPAAPTDSRAGIFARLAIRASREGLLWGDVRKALRGAFEAMEADATIADEVKKLARKGIDAGAEDSLTDEEGVRVRLKVMDEIIEIAMKEEEARRAALREELADLNEKLHGDGDSDSIEVNDDYVIVDGIRIEVHKNSGGK